MSDRLLVSTRKALFTVSRGGGEWAISGVDFLGSNVTLTMTDTVGTTSFNTAGHWSDGATPTSTNDYSVTGGLTLRTPGDAVDHTFAGKSLTLGSGTLNSGLLGFKGTGAHTVTVNDLRLNGAQLSNATDNSTATMAGNITLMSGGTILQSQTGTARPSGI